MSETPIEKRLREDNIEQEVATKKFKPEIEVEVEVEVGETTGEASSNTPAATQTSFPPTAIVETALHRSSNSVLPPPVSKFGLKPKLPVLPPSLELVTGIKTDLAARHGFVGQEDVGIIGYAGPGDVSGIKGIIKQRFTDFLVNEVLPSGEVLHLKDITKPKEPVTATPVPTATNSSTKESEVETAKDADTEEKPATEPALPTQSDEAAAPSPDVPATLLFDPIPLWPATTSHKLRPYFSEETIIALHSLLIEGRNPPPKADAGWGSRKPKAGDAAEETAEEAAMNAESSKGGLIHVEEPSESRGQGRDRGRGRGRGRGGGRGGGPGPSDWWSANEDKREVVSQIIPAKEDRAAAHKIIRELFGGTFESNARELKGESGQRLAIKWGSSRGGARAANGGQSNKPRPPQQPPYIHFTMQKSNRDTQDCLANLSRMLSVQPKDLSVCGTKDKRGVTVQRVCLKRGRMDLQAVWKAVNGIRSRRQTEEQAVKQRGERGCRIGDLEYSKQYLELGMLKGNNFLITLRNVEADSREVIDRIMESLRDRGFINFYGMQRFGTSTVPTHVTGLLLLQSKWTEAIDSLLELREGEHPDCVRGRLAWLEDNDFNKALELMPRRCVAERSIWEFWKRGRAVEDRIGALNNLPRNLRTMYVHAYQSYIWNLVVSARIKLSPGQPMVGDLVYADKAIEDQAEEPKLAGGNASKKGWETTSSPDVKQLTESDLTDYTIFDVVMPLPGWNVDYPGGAMAQLYFDLMKADGLDPNRMRRDQREFSLPGSYRKIINKPAHVSWTHIRYTDPDISLVQSDEDRILGIDPAAQDDLEGKFHALQISMTLGTSAYATMALREITREETAVWHQTNLTNEGADQAHKGMPSTKTEGNDGAEDETQETPDADQ